MILLRTEGSIHLIFFLPSAMDRTFVPFPLMDSVTPSLFNKPIARLMVIIAEENSCERVLGEGKKVSNRIFFTINSINQFPRDGMTNIRLAPCIRFFQICLALSTCVILVVFKISGMNQIPKFFFFPLSSQVDHLP